MDINEVISYAFVASLAIVLLISLKMHSYASKAVQGLNQFGNSLDEASTKALSLSEAKKELTQMVLEKADRLAVEKRIGQAIHLLAGKKKKREIVVESTM